MWILYAFGSAFFAGITAILAKCGIRRSDSDAATAVRTVIVLLFSWLMVLINGSGGKITSLGGKTWVFLILSGLATGASWLCCFKALKTGDVNRVVPIDKSSTVLTVLSLSKKSSKSWAFLRKYGIIEAVMKVIVKGRENRDQLEIFSIEGFVPADLRKFKT